MTLTIRKLVEFWAPALKKKNRILCPLWPGDVFAICLSLLDKSGAISGVGVEYLRESLTSRNARLHRLQKVASEWRINSGLKKRLPVVSKLWRRLIEDFGETRIEQLANFSKARTEKPHEVCETLIELIVLADEVFAGVGISNDVVASDADHGDTLFWIQCDELLTGANSTGTNGGATLCSDLVSQHIRVLPKAQLPPSGLSIRSLTKHVSVCPNLDVTVNWCRYFSFKDERTCNLLLVPWPFEVFPIQFRDLRLSKNDDVGWFGVQLDSDWHAPVTKTKWLLERARREVGPIDTVIFPESSLTPDQHEELRKYLSAQGVPLIAGVYQLNAKLARNQESGLARNYAAMTFPELSWGEGGNSFEQDKHHRWRLTSSQIESYGISTQLDPEKTWWEGIGLSNRSINFFLLRDWLCSCILICEDLARIDPVGSIVRCVAPDLVIALLFDGPQIATRWPAYHATVLSDDPGSSVLTLSCLGMTQMSRPRGVEANSVTSRTVGMWRDPRKGLIPIQIPEGKEGAILTIRRSAMAAVTADGRRNTRTGYGPEFASLHFL